MLVADVIHFAADGIPVQRRVVGAIQHGVCHGPAQPPVIMPVADNERHPVVDGRNAGIGGGGQQHETFFRQRQVKARLFDFFPQAGHAKEIALAADEPHGDLSGFHS